MQVKPFKEDLDNNLQTNCLLAIVLTVFYGIFSKMKALTLRLEIMSGGPATSDNMAVLDSVVIALNVIVLVSTLGTFALLTVSLFQRRLILLSLADISVLFTF